uniref:Dynein light chain roadblock n=1 Tax=Hemiselmis andersenii TaxID=464988 RepID=A0A6U5AEL1_HEMAN
MAAQSSEIDETMKKLTSHPGVIGFLVTNADGIPIRSSLDHAEAVQYAGLLTLLATKARAAVRELDSQNDVTFLRLRSKKHEILVAPDKEYLLMVIQNPQVKS